MIDARLGSANPNVTLRANREASIRRSSQSDSATPTSLSRSTRIATRYRRWKRKLLRKWLRWWLGVSYIRLALRHVQFELNVVRIAEYDHRTEVPGLLFPVLHALLIKVLKPSVVLLLRI